ncbi:MAG: Dam family site-specific DNA-(adenine-N6)-methyltransferase [Cytophagales bacterium]|nr:Dam family site-specific DNA-(adenine-N6)-methyltransferase [Cytophagales bacterium]
MNDSIKIKPFIRWAGGKQNLIKEINLHLPKKRINKYFEPFLGAGSVFFSNSFDDPYLSDINASLIHAYLAIKNNPNLLSKYIEEYRVKVCQKFYYQIREDFNNNINSTSIKQAARFIFLIHTSFNGIYRVNKQGKYNVPFGKSKPALPSLRQMIYTSEKLKNANITVSSFGTIIHKTNHNDFVYLDPPYPPLNGTSSFQHYTMDKFPQAKQEKLAEFAKELNNKGVLVAISNADIQNIRDMYKTWNIFQFETTRYISCKAKRHKVQEIIIKNY